MASYCATKVSVNNKTDVNILAVAVDIIGLYII